MTIFRILLITFSIIFSYYNYVIFDSYKMQTGITFDFNRQEFKSDNYQKLKNSNIDFPNISATAFPLYAFLAKYQIMFKDYDGALNTLYENNNVNPYMRIKESLLAEAYLNLGIRDSSFHYSKIAYENLPSNSRHFQQYIMELVFRKDLNKINEVFLKSRAKYNYQYWLNYFSAVINLKNESSRPLIDSLAKEAIIKFPKNENIKIITSYILVGQENVKESYDLFNEGLTYFKKSNFNLSSERFISAYNLNPLDYSFSENAGMSLIKEQKFEKAIEYFKISADYSDKPDDGKSEFGLAYCYKELQQKNLACEYFVKSKEKNYKPAFGYLSSYCN